MFSLVTPAKMSIAPVNRNSESNLLSMSLTEIIHQIKVRRITLGIKDELVAEYLEITLGTYKKHKARDFMSFSIYDLQKILRLFSHHEYEKLNRENKRIQNHSRNVALLQSDEDDETPDDGNNGDYAY